MGCTPAPTCTAALAEASSLWTNRSRASDGICSSPTHRQQSPNSDHDYGNAFDLTHDPANGCDAHHLAELLINIGDPRVKYVISASRIHNPSRDQPGQWRPYTGSNRHDKHIHVSIHASARGDLRPWWTPLLEDDVTEQDKDEIVERVIATLGRQLDEVQNAIAGWATDANGARSSATRSLIGRIGDHLKVKR